MKKLISILLLLVSVFFAESCLMYLASREELTSDDRKLHEASLSYNGKMYYFEYHHTLLSGFNFSHPPAADFSFPIYDQEHASAYIELYGADDSSFYDFHFGMKVKSDTTYFRTNTRYTDFEGVGVKVYGTEWPKWMEGSWVEFSYPSESSTNVLFYIDLEYVCLSEDGSKTFNNGHFTIYNNVWRREEYLHDYLKDE